MIVLEDVSRAFRSRGRLLPAVDSVSLHLSPKEVLCLVGESGSGKTTTGRLVAGLIRPTSGRILFEGRDVWSLVGKEGRRYRRSVQLIHQDPYACLNPVRTVFETLAAPLRQMGAGGGGGAQGNRDGSPAQTDRSRSAGSLRSRVAALLERVELRPADSFLDKFPHQLSGGQRQRVAVARALSVDPAFVVADEAVSMIDVSLRISLLNLLLRLRREAGVGFLFITHDLAVARHFGWEGRTAVMYLGRLVEVGPTPEVIRGAQHPYTRALLAAVPEADPRITRTKERLRLRSQDPPSLLQVPPGCAFHPRCPWAEPGLCDVRRPELERLGALEVACHVAVREGGLPAMPPAQALAST